MNTAPITSSLTTLLGELVNGAPGSGGYILDGGDQGLLRSLAKLSAADASRPTPTGSSIAAHVDHVRYGLSLMNRWSGGENPFRDADWSASWRRRTVSEAEWEQLRAGLLQEASRWIETLGRARETSEVELNGMLGSIAHLAYHLGAIRQINQLARGPAESGPVLPG
jgi:hypothetical protein